MAAYRVLAVFDLGLDVSAGLPVGDGVLAPFWGPGLDFGYSDGVTLTVSACSTAPTCDAAAADVVARCIGAWSMASGGDARLTPATVRVLPQVHPEVNA